MPILKHEFLHHFKLSKICKKLMEHEIGTFDNLARKSAKYKKIKSTNSFKVYPIFLHPIFFTKFSTTTFSVISFKLLELVGNWTLFLKLQVSMVILMYFEGLWDVTRPQGGPSKKPFSPFFLWFLRNTWADGNKIGINRCVSSIRIHWYALQPISY